jgi:predicted nucleic acid-binding protein
VSLAVIDASVLVSFYATDDPLRQYAVTRLAAGNAMFAPAHVDAEVVSALRRLAHGNRVLAEAVPRALTHLAGLPLQRMPIAPMLDRIWSLRDNVTPYDAAYVALAEQLDCVLITCDAKLANATGPQCTFDLIS